MACGIFVLPVICIMIKVSTSETNVTDENMNCEAQLSEMNTRMYAMERTMNWFFPEIMDNLKDNKNEIEALKSKVNCERNDQPEYTVHYFLKNQADAGLVCNARGSHLVSFESVDERDHVYELIQHQCSNMGFWTSAKKPRAGGWVWSNSGELIIDEVWGAREPSGDGDCAHMFQSRPKYALNDLSCAIEMCFICESP